MQNTYNGRMVLEMVLIEESGYYNLTDPKNTETVKGLLFQVIMAGFLPPIEKMLLNRLLRTANTNEFSILGNLI